MLGSWPLVLLNAHFQHLREASMMLSQHVEKFGKVGELGSLEYVSWDKSNLLW